MNAAKAIWEQEVVEAANTHVDTVNAAIGTYNATTENIQNTYDTAVAAAEAAYNTTITTIVSNANTQVNATLQQANADLISASNTYENAIAQANADHPTVASALSGSGSGSGSSSASGSNSGSSSSSSSNSTSGSNSSSGSTSGSASGSGSSSGSGTSSASSSGTGISSLLTSFESAFSVTGDGTYSLVPTGDTYIDGVAGAWVNYNNDLNATDSTYLTDITSAATDWESANDTNVDALSNASTQAKTAYDAIVDAAASTYVSGVDAAYISYGNAITAEMDTYNSIVNSAYSSWKTKSINAGKSYISTVNAAWSSYQTTVVQAAINAKGQMEQAIFAYQDWYENEPYPHGYSGEDLDGDGIYEVPGGPDLVPGKQHELAVTIATVNLDLQSKYANALYVYTVAEWDAWLTFATDTTNANTEYSISVTNAERDYIIATNAAGSSLDTTLTSLENAYNTAASSANASYVTSMANNVKNFNSSQAQALIDLVTANNNAKLTQIQSGNELAKIYSNIETAAWYQDQRNNGNLTTDEYADTYEWEQWETKVTNATFTLGSAYEGVILGLYNAILDISGSVTGAIAGADYILTESLTNAERDRDNGYTSAEFGLWGSVIGADITYSDALANINATLSNTETSLWAGLQIGAANVSAALGKHEAALARDAKIKTAKDHLDSVTNDTSSSDYYLDGNNYSDAFEFVPEGYYYEAGLYLDFGPPAGAVVSEVQEWISSLETNSGNIPVAFGEQVANSGSTSGSGSGSGSGSSSGSGSLSGSGSTSGSSSGSGSGSTSSSGSGSSSTSGSGTSSGSGSTSGSGGTGGTGMTDEELLLASTGNINSVLLALLGANEPGHHWIPQSVIERLSSILSEKAQKIFYKGTTIPGGYHHGNDTWNGVTHPKYNKAVEELITGLAADAGGTINEAKAKEILEWVKTGKNIPQKTKVKYSQLWETIELWRDGFNRSIKVAKAASDAGFASEAKAIAKRIVNNDKNILISKEAEQALKSGKLLDLKKGAFLLGLLPSALLPSATNAAGDVVFEGIGAINVASSSKYYPRALEALRNGEIDTAEKLLLGSERGANEGLYDEIFYSGNEKAALTFLHYIGEKFAQAK